MYKNEIYERENDMEQLSKNKSQHIICMKNRESIEISGVSDVISFDDVGIVLSTECGVLSIDGKDLHIVTLNVDDGKVAITGTVNGIIYPESSGSRSVGFFRRKGK